MFQTSQEACLDDQVGGTHLVCVVVLHHVCPQPLDGVPRRAGFVTTLGIADAVPGEELSCLGVVVGEQVWSRPAPLEGGVDNVAGIVVAVAPIH